MTCREFRRGIHRLLADDSASSLSTLRRHAEECQSRRDGWDASKPFSRRLMRALRSQMMCRPNR